MQCTLFEWYYEPIQCAVCESADDLFGAIVKKMQGALDYYLRTKEDPSPFCMVEKILEEGLVEKLNEQILAKNMFWLLDIWSDFFQRKNDSYLYVEPSVYNEEPTAQQPMLTFVDTFQKESG